MTTCDELKIAGNLNGIYWKGQDQRQLDSKLYRVQLFSADANVVCMTDAGSAQRAQEGDQGQWRLCARELLLCRHCGGGKAGIAIYTFGQCVIAMLQRSCLQILYMIAVYQSHQQNRNI